MSFIYSHVYADPGSVGEAQAGLMCAELSNIPVRVDKVQGLNLDLHSCGGDCMTCINKVISTNANQNAHNNVWSKSY